MEYFNRYVALVNGFKLITLISLISADFLLGVILAIFTKTFKWSELARFLNTDVLQLMAGYFMVGAIALLEPALSFSVPATWGIIDAKLIADIIAKLKKLGVIFKPA